jgi:hypothetical protein
MPNPTTIDCHIVPSTQLIIDLVKTSPNYNVPAILRDPLKYSIHISVIMKSGQKGLIRCIDFDDDGEAWKHYYTLKECL